MIKNEYSLGLPSSLKMEVQKFINKNLDTIQISNENDLHGIMDYLLKGSFKKYSKIQLEASNDVALKLKAVIKTLGFEFLLYEDNNDHTSLANQIKSLFEIQTKNWDSTYTNVQSQLKNLMLPISRHLESLESVALKPITLQSLVQTYQLRALKLDPHFELDLKLDSSNYLINKDEFISLREKIQLASELYDEKFFSNKSFEKYNSILFDMLTAVETEHLIFDQITNGLEHLKTNLKNVKSVILKYKQDLFHHYHGQLSHLLHQFRLIKNEVIHLDGLNNPSRSNLTSNLLSKWMSNNKDGSAKDQLLLKYAKLKSEWDNTIFSKNLRFEAFSDWKSLNNAIQSNNIETVNWGKIIQRQIANQLSRLTYNNGNPLFFDKNEVSKIKDDIKITIDEVNKNKIFYTALEDNTLYLKNTIDFLEQTIFEWQNVIAELPLMASYHPWRKFWDEQDPKAKNLCIALFDLKFKNLIFEFENWYFRLIIEKNLSPHLLSNQETIDEATRHKEIQRNLQRAMLRDRLIKDLKENIIKYKKQHPTLSKWKQHNQMLPIVDDLTINELTDLFPIRLSSNKAVNSSKQLVLVVNCKNGVFCFNHKNDSRGKLSNTDKFTIAFPPQTDKSIINSDHSHRWKELKIISTYLSRINRDITLFENKDSLILSFFNNQKINEIITLQHDTPLKIETYSSKQIESELTESFLDNNRTMEFVTYDGFLFPTSVSEDVIWQNELIDFLQYIGLKEIAHWTKSVDIWDLNSNSSNDIRVSKQIHDSSTHESTASIKIV